MCLFGKKGRQKKCAGAGSVLLLLVVVVVVQSGVLRQTEWEWLCVSGTQKVVVEVQ